MTDASRNGAGLASACGERCLAVFSRHLAVPEERVTCATVFAEETPVVGNVRCELVASDWNVDGFAPFEALAVGVIQGTQMLKK